MAARRFRTLVEATRETIRNPEDTSHVFRIAEVLSLGAPTRMARRARRQAPTLLREKPRILGRLCDRRWLETRPVGSVAESYLRFIDREGITPEGLVEASVASGSGSPVPATGDTEWIKQRMRDSHDLWHVITGYHGDLLGETALLAFTFAQSRHPGVGFLTALGLFLSTFPIGKRDLVNGDGEPTSRGPNERRLARRFIVAGFARGWRADSIVALPWEQLLEEPLDVVRSQLGVLPVGNYEQVRPAR